MVALANATQVNATETLSELTTKDGAPLKLTNEMFGLAPTTGDVTTNTTTPCGVLESLDQDSFNSEMWDKVLGARGGVRPFLQLGKRCPSQLRTKSWSNRCKRLGYRFPNWPCLATSRTRQPGRKRFLLTSS